jgi:hypothetical protein
MFSEAVAPLSNSPLLKGDFTEIVVLGVFMRFPFRFDGPPRRPEAALNSEPVEESKHEIGLGNSLLTRCTEWFGGRGLGVDSIPPAI